MYSSAEGRSHSVREEVTVEGGAEVRICTNGETGTLGGEWAAEALRFSRAAEAAALGGTYLVVGVEARGAGAGSRCIRCRRW